MRAFVSLMLALGVTLGLCWLLAWMHTDRLLLQPQNSYSTHFYKRYKHNIPMRHKTSLKKPLKSAKKRPKKSVPKPLPPKIPLQTTAPSPAQNQADEQYDVTDISELDQEAVVIKTVTPKYPDIARKAGIEGQVLLSIIVDEKGRVIHSVILHSSQKGYRFEQHALEAVEKLRFEPFIKEGVAIKVKVVYPIHFVLVE
ncbi:MAG: energy transducer TonB [bacterium]